MNKKASSKTDKEIESGRRYRVAMLDRGANQCNVTLERAALRDLAFLIKIVGTKKAAVSEAIRAYAKVKMVSRRTPKPLVKKRK